MGNKKTARKKDEFRLKSNHSDGGKRQIRPDLRAVFTLNVFLSFSDWITSDSNASYFWNFAFFFPPPPPPQQRWLEHLLIEQVWRSSRRKGKKKKQQKKNPGSLRAPSEETQTPRVTEVLIKTEKKKEKKGRMLKQWEKRLLPLKFSSAWQTAEPGRGGSC